MSSQLYPKAREKFLTAQLSWLVGDYRAILLPESYVFDDSDQFLADVFPGVRIAISELITNRTATNGYADCDPINFGTLVDARNAAKLIVFKDTGDENTSDLICFIDQDDVQNTPLALIGLEYFFVPNDVEGGLFRL